MGEGTNGPGPADAAIVAGRGQSCISWSVSTENWFIFFCVFWFKIENIEGKLWSTKWFSNFTRQKCNPLVRCGERRWGRGRANDDVCEW